MKHLVMGLCFLMFFGCAPRKVSRTTLESISTPAFVSWTRANAGPKANVFRADDTWRRKFTQLSAREADENLAKALYGGMSRFEVAETLRAKVYKSLPHSPPWMNAPSAAEVNRALQSLLVTDAESEAPDYAALTRIGVDVAVELVVEDYGLKSSHGKTTTFLVGYGRMFRLGGGDLWRRTYEVQLSGEGQEILNPIEILSQPNLFRLEMNHLLDAVVAQFVEDLTPP